MALLVTVVGFDEKFAVRSFLRRGRTQVTEVLAVRPSRADPRSDRALNALKSLLEEASVPISVMELDQLDFVSSVAKVAKWVRRSSHSEFVVNLSSGMRIVGLEVLAAFLLLNLDAEVEVEAEDFSGFTTWRTTDLLPTDMDPKTLELLRLVRQGLSVTEVANRTRLSVTTAWRRLKRMEEARLLWREGDKLSLTLKGEVYLAISEK
ncbi:CRISPR-associated protein [Sulfodiicoccus acidiphilus]|uniref:CRISPR-associated protein n=1 Tax=Sulfodiicoccus acidiphilus TaxID=1670455 RepID=A0A348B5X6_9CREN|nr:CRISPR-associated CARF protein Csa3 [Sulfodiicoccus acidiphilus]BBD73578.1 CRISPR-associated protein [Sulfodiicoccus acidiphilus]GGU01732.1 CRISPR-associated protein [Sulfodiicoccus acidiphilus]